MLHELPYRQMTTERAMLMAVYGLLVAVAKRLAIFRYRTD